MDWQSDTENSGRVAHHRWAHATSMALLTFLRIRVCLWQKGPTISSLKCMTKSLFTIAFYCFTLLSQGYSDCSERLARGCTSQSGDVSIWSPATNVFSTKDVIQQPAMQDYLRISERGFAKPWRLYFDSLTGDLRPTATSLNISGSSFQNRRISQFLFWPSPLQLFEIFLT